MSADAVVVGAGPNGLAAALTLARAGLSVEIYERADRIGGGMRTNAVDGFLFDACSAVHPMALSSPFMKTIGIADLDVVVPQIAYAQAISRGFSGLAAHSLDRTAAGLGADGRAWRRVFEPLVENFEAVAQLTHDPLNAMHHPMTVLQLARRVLEQGSFLRASRFRDSIAPALLAGVAAHSAAPQPSLASSAVGLVLAIHAHTTGWPIPIGGSEAIVRLVEPELRAAGVKIHTSAPIPSLRDAPPAGVRILDVDVWSFVRMGGDQIPARYKRMVNHFRPGVGAAKVDFALSEEVPWADASLRASGVVHIGGDARTVADAERRVSRSDGTGVPFVLVSQPSVFDRTRAPAGKHTLWTYAHVPNGSIGDPTSTIIDRIEEFAPGFRDVIISTSARSAAQMQEYNPNYLGGDIYAGAITLRQLVARPVPARYPWRTPVPRTYLCSSSTPPGPGVHGMSGVHAASLALRDHFGIPPAAPD
jgi:phytoene dehydrogenase-like protein